MSGDLAAAEYGRTTPPHSGTNDLRGEGAGKQGKAGDTQQRQQQKTADEQEKTL